MWQERKEKKLVDGLPSPAINETKSEHGGMENCIALITQMQFGVSKQW